MIGLEKRKAYWMGLGIAAGKIGRTLMVEMALKPYSPHFFEGSLDGFACRLNICLNFE